MATNQPRMTTAQMRAERRPVTRLMRNPQPRQEKVIHYALDLEHPPLIACEAPDNPPSSTEPQDVTCTDCMSHEQFPLSVVKREREGTMALQPEAAAEIRGYDVLTTAAMMLGTDSFNPEYERAIVELTAALIGAKPEDYELMERILRTLAQGM